MTDAGVAIAIGAAAVALWQTIEARLARREARIATAAAEKATSVAEEALELSKKQDTRGAVKWAFELHPQQETKLLFRNVGHSTAYDVEFDARDLSGLRTQHLSIDWKVTPGESACFWVVSPSDLKDVPDSVRITFKLERFGKETQTVVIPLIEHHAELRRRADQWKRRYVDEPAQMQAEMKVLLERIPTAAARRQQAADAAATPDVPEEAPPSSIELPPASTSER